MQAHILPLQIRTKIFTSCTHKRESILYRRPGFTSTQKSRHILFHKTAIKWCLKHIEYELNGRLPTPSLYTMFLLLICYAEYVIISSTALAMLHNKCTHLSNKDKQQTNGEYLSFSNWHTSHISISYKQISTHYIHRYISSIGFGNAALACSR